MFWFRLHAEIRRFARVRVVSDFIAAEVRREGRHFGFAPVGLVVGIAILVSRRDDITAEVPI
jgi:hypothetical protein